MRIKVWREAHGAKRGFMSRSKMYFSSDQKGRRVQEIAPLLGQADSQRFSFGLKMNNVFVCGIAAVSTLSSIAIGQIGSEVFA